MVAAAAAEEEEPDLSGQCSGEKLDGSQCPRLATEEGGSVQLQLCRRCHEKQAAVSGLAKDFAESKGGAKKLDNTTENTTVDSRVDAGFKKKEKHAKSKGKTMGLDALLKRYALFEEADPPPCHLLSSALL